MEVSNTRVLLVPETLGNNQHVVLQFSTCQRSFHMNFTAIDRPLLRTDRKRWKNVMVPFTPSAG